MLHRMAVDWLHRLGSKRNNQADACLGLFVNLERRKECARVSKQKIEHRPVALAVNKVLGDTTRYSLLTAP